MSNGDEIQQWDSLSRDQVNEAVSFEEAVKAAIALGVTPEEMVVEFDTYTPLGQDKSELVGVPFFIRQIYIKADQETGAEYAQLFLVTKEHKRYRMTDGGTGIFIQAQGLTERSGRDHSFMVPGGLRRSDYTYTDGNGKKSPATTFYLA